MKIMSILIGIKNRLSKSINGRIVIKIYHFAIAIPLAKFYSMKYYFIKNSLKEIRFYSFEETFEMLKTQKKTLCRFGDGEIAWIYKDSKGYFGQENSEELSDRLREIIISNEKNILVGIPDFFGALDHYTSKHKASRNTHLAKYHKKWSELLDPKKYYTDALISRVYYGRKDNISHHMFNSWKSVWSEKDLIIIEGNQTRFGIGNDLLENSNSIKRIIAPAENAFKKYDEILNVAKRNISEDVLFLISLGPSATVLAYDIGLSGGQAIDIGHLDIEYEWFLSGSNKKKSVVGKYVNEAGGEPIEEFPDNELKIYNNQIIKRII